MTKTVNTVLGIGILLLTNVGNAGPKYLDGTITKQVDGDTVWFMPDGEKFTHSAPPKTLKIRMLALDAPETHLVTPQGPMGQQPWGDQAAEYLKTLLPLSTQVVIDDQGKDMYGRTLGRVFRSHVDVDLEMVEAGWAIPYIICDGPRCNTNFFDAEKVEDYVIACENAQNNGLGIFDPANPLKEMPFEFRVRMQNRQYEKYVGDFKTKRLYAPTDYPRVPLCQRIFFLTLKEAQKAGYSMEHELQPLVGLLQNQF